MVEEEKAEEKEGEDLIFESGRERRDPPLFENEDHGVTVWADTDKNGDTFLKLRLPLGMGTVPLFVNENGYEDIQDSVNKLIEHLKKD